MLDPEIFEKLNPESNSISVPSVRPLNKDKLTDEQIMTVNTVLLGFSLGDKIWGKQDPVASDDTIPDSDHRRFRRITNSQGGLE